MDRLQDEFPMSYTQADSLHEDREQCPCRKCRNTEICIYQANQREESDPKIGIVSLEVPREDPEESLRFNRVVEAG